MNIPSDERLEAWRDLLRHVPVSVNNYYGDPTIQWHNTIEKLDKLLASRHSGPVGIITKGKISATYARQIADFREKGLDIILFFSISELPQFEHVAMRHRYDNIAVCNARGIPCVAYVRPMTPPYNTSPEIIDTIFEDLKRVGADAIVSSGFRGDENLIKDMTPDETVRWALHVKLMTKDVFERMRDRALENGMRFFTRTSCAVSYLSKDTRTYNPYYNSPNLVRCDEVRCPLRDTCSSPVVPKEHSLDFMEFLGYEIEYKRGRDDITCRVQPDKRLGCPSCCTTCFMLDVPRLMVKNANGLGDFTFIRFVTGLIAMKDGCRDDGSKDIGSVHLPSFPEIQDIDCLNTWWPYATVGDKCFDSTRKEFGFPPALLLEKISSILKSRNALVSPSQI
jgi:hypothetical protein